MSTTTMQFGPEWMRTKHQPLARSQLPPSPPPSSTIPASGLSSYSALVSAIPPAATESSDEVHPFRYSKDELLRIYQEGGGKGGLGLEVERWEGVVRDASAEPVALREMTEAEKKLFAGPLNSELRRRGSQSADYISPLTTSALERPRLAHNSSTSAISPLRERFGGLKRRDSATGPTEVSTLSIPRKPSLSSLQSPAMSPREASPRTKVGYTPNFDGVLNNGDSWVVRRRTEASMKIGNGPGREASEKQQGSRSSEILEEKEDMKHEDSSFTSSPQARQYSAVVGGLDSGTSADRRDGFTTNESINSRAYGADIGPPPGLIDLAAVEWSYKDPTGQVQGPFRADLMQKWYNDGYFSSDLPMKRVQHDTHWTTVAVLVQRSNGENIFFSPLLAPALGPGNDSLSQNLPTAERMFGEPFQPAPMRSLRTSTLESYINAGSLASDSPSSSLGASHFGNPSPDPTAFGGRENKPYAGGDLGRMPGFSLQDHTSIFGDRRPIGHEFPVNALINEYQTALQQQQGPSFGNVVRDRDLNFNSYALNNSPVSHDTWTASNIHGPSAFGNNREQGSERLFSSLNTQPSVHPNQIQAHTEGNHQEPFPTIFNQDVILNDSFGDDNDQTQGPTDLHPLNYGHYDFSGQPLHNAQEIPPSRDLDESSLRHVNTFGFRNLNVDTVASQSPRNISPALPAQSPWEVLPDHSINQRSATVNAIPQLLANIDAQPVASTSQHSPWRRVDHNPTFIPQTSGHQVPGSLTTGSLGQQHQHEEASDAMNKLSLGSLVHKRDILSAPDSALTEPAILSPIRPSARMPSNQQSSPDQTPSGEPAPVPKVAWAKEEEGKRKKGSTASLNIREIQEAEVKKAESRKAAERQKDRSARVTSTMDIKEDHQPFTTSWGLPTSQAGARGNIATREPLVATAQTPPSTHVWTTPLKQPILKKTMKEIQEEEETRKRLVAKQTFTPAVPKKAHAETTKPTTTLFASSSNNAWTTVGPSGKTSAVLTSTPRPSAPLSSGSALSAVPHVSSPPVQKTPPLPTLKTRPSANKPDTLNETPSHEFLKWLSDSLKGLNSSVNVEEIVSMLLSFPLDPDASTIEIISDTIYSNSTTLDGRRFASEFVARRKADAHVKSKGASIPGKAAVKPVSIADVVKAAPKAAQPEWGFKVVNKKKKGGRS